MILVIDTTDKECMVGLGEGSKLDITKWRWEKDTGGEVLDNIQKLLKKRPPRLGETGQKKLENIETIFVNQGPGSYTGTRVGITIANTLGWSLNIPVKGYSGKDFRKSKKNHFPAPIYE